VSDSIGGEMVAVGENKELQMKYADVMDMWWRRVMEETKGNEASGLQNNGNKPSWLHIETSLIGSIWRTWNGSAATDKVSWLEMPSILGWI
jgi:hypothetical protein